MSSDEPPHQIHSYTLLFLLFLYFLYIIDPPPCTLTTHDCTHMKFALASSDRSHLFDGHMIYDSHVLTSILRISNMHPPMVQPITSPHTMWSGTLLQMSLMLASCLPFVFNLPVFYLSLRSSSEKSHTIAHTSFPQN